MAFFMVTFTYPATSSKEVGETFLSGNTPKLPEFVKQEKVFVVLDKKVKNYVIYEVEDEKAHDALMAIATRFTGYFNIKDSQFKIEHLMTTREALPLIGLK
ncbi:MAG: hypothetical protein GF317_19875 [Candidatus Lokiarchaeota archaeon]|nr:hypothetical protein [Candidatus Lokiarchaeota archaeon]MBD3201752.1 hypothetical protein [Candidatus Lokiarchaeota archaeon]